MAIPRRSAELHRQWDWFWFMSRSLLPSPRHHFRAKLGHEANDFSVGTAWEMVGPDYDLIDVFRARLEYPDLRRKNASLAARSGAGTF
jgi:hypothetical protein